ncbi:DUF1707 domain-containing protein [Patulibacter sp. SYSU D01012]|uniref:DUF1707 SHOCT-like domain-containing protein n=1 Tax=Patulibacter sp. SYSU D01012 TaxID=2817381 RepID=UPI001B315C10
MADRSSSPFGAFADVRDLRVGDRERDAAQAELVRAYAAGRIDADELEERLGVAAQARTALELAGAFRGLPGAAARVATAPARARGAALARGADRAAIRVHAATFAGANGGAVALWAVAGAGAPWPLAVLLPSGALLAGHVAVRRRVRRALVSRRGPTLGRPQRRAGA